LQVNGDNDLSLGLQQAVTYIFIMKSYSDVGFRK